MVLWALRHSYDILPADQVTLYVFLTTPAFYCCESAGVHRDPTGDKSFPHPRPTLRQTVPPPPLTPHPPPPSPLHIPKSAKNKPPPSSLPP